MPDKDSKKLVVLLAEDEAVVSFVFERVLSSLGCEVFTAKDGREAVELLEQTSFDLLVLDWNMPEIDGWFVAVEARKRLGPQIPIVIISGNENAKELMYREYGVINAVFQKPFTRHDFASLIRKYCPTGKELAATPV